MHMGYPVVESLNGTELEEDLQVDLELKGGKIYWMGMQTHKEEGGMGRDQKGQGKEQRCICSPPYLLHSLFSECKFFSKEENIPVFALV